MAKKTVQKLGPNGHMPVDLGWRGGFQKFTVAGGPFDHFAQYDLDHDNAFGVCVRAERAPQNLDLHLPIHDFSVPENTALVRETLRRTISAAMSGKAVYVGCMGGWGRTGLFLALLAKVCGEEDPVGYVRKHYTPRAVETELQKLYVETFDVSELQSQLAWSGWTKWTLARVFWWR